MHPVMMLWSTELAVVPVTIHLPLRDVELATLTTDLVFETGRIVARDLASRFGICVRASRSPVSTRMPARKAQWARKTA